ncbi:MAG TPA: HAD-IC family P-type ATPase, partial [Gemmataceae bacterium]|nr:HAD-IC family P-type ATPase [Gemmataceae bacterium]
MPRYTEQRACATVFNVSCTMNSAYLGLTTADVADRVRAGQVNRAPRTVWTDYGRIVSRNVLTVFNALVTPAAIALFYVGKYQGAWAVSCMAIVNSAVGLVQEIKAKRHLDKLAILVQTKARVRRDGVVCDIPAEDVVLGDLVLVGNGETVIADGMVIDAKFLEVDEALLTGESDPVRRQAGDMLLSGSFCVAGEGSYRADKVGPNAFAQSTAAAARGYKLVHSPLTRTINLLIHLLTWTAVGLCLIFVLLFWLDKTNEDDMISNMAATITSMVPQGLVLTATIAFTLGAIQMSMRGAIVQRLNAVESMAAIDVICTDKTGTLTTNQLRLDQIRAVQGCDEAEGKRLLTLFAAASLDRKNKSVMALHAALGEAYVELLDQVPFKSQNRYSAVRIRDGGVDRVLVLGAAEALSPHLMPDNAGNWQQLWQELLPTGLRLLLLAEAMQKRPFDGKLDGFQLRPLLLVAFSDELRPEAGQVLEALAAQGIAFKVISGDNPETVRATVSHLNLPLAHDPVVTGDQLQSSPNAQELIASRGVFGRIAPLQKVQIVQTLQEMGRHVAMIGDGVNDVLPIKKADLGIAMGDGSQAAKTVSSLVLENNNFALLPETLEEGRTILRNVRRSAKLFLVKNVYSFLLILAYASGLFGVPFPYEPQQVTLLNWLVIGIPALVIALSRERSTAATKPRFLMEVGWFAIRTGVIFAVAGFTMLVLAVHVFNYEVKLQKTLLLSLLIFLGISALLRALRDGEKQTLKGDTRF